MLLLGNLKELHKKFLSQMPCIKVSLSLFTKLRPPFCILASPKGIHNVCVCKIHQNMRLKFYDLKQELARKHVNYNKTYRDVLNAKQYSPSTSQCCLSTCDTCPGVAKAINSLKALLRTNRISKLSFDQWLTTDR